MNLTYHSCASQESPQPRTERDQQQEGERELDRAFDRILAKGGQLKALLALMSLAAVDEEVVPMHRLAACQLAWELTEDMLVAAAAALAATS